jgi:hypothetical protein
MELPPLTGIADGEALDRLSLRKGEGQFRCSGWQGDQQECDGSHKGLSPTGSGASGAITLGS